MNDRANTKRKFSADPRFGALAAGSPAIAPQAPPLHLSTFADPVDEVAAQAMAQRRELFRIAGVAALERSRNGRDLDPAARADAVRWAAVEPLGVALGTGEPV